MGKICLPIGGATGSLNGRPCIPLGLGNCEGSYRITYGFAPVFDPTTQTVNFTGFFNATIWNFVPAGRDPLIRGRITCITQPSRSSIGQWIAFVTSTHPNRQGLEQFNAVNVTPGFSSLLQQPQFIGIFYRGQEICELDNTCVCTGGDEQINCPSAQGGICCIPRASIDLLCARLN